MYNIHTKYTTLPRGVGGFPVLQFLWKIKKMYTLYNLHFFFLYKNLQSAKQDIYTVISVSFVFYDIEKYWKKPPKSSSLRRIPVDFTFFWNYNKVWHLRDNFYKVSHCESWLLTFRMLTQLVFVNLYIDQDKRGSHYTVKSTDKGYLKID